jgi:hypothetical protein
VWKALVAKQKADVEVKRADERWQGELMGELGGWEVVKFGKPW